MCWADGLVEEKQGTSKELVVLFGASKRSRTAFFEDQGLTPRDVRLLGTKGAHLSIRQDYFMFRLPPFTGASSDSENEVKAMIESTRLRLERFRAGAQRRQREGCGALWEAGQKANRLIL